MIALKHKREKKGKEDCFTLQKNLDLHDSSLLQCCICTPPEVGCWNSTVADPGQEVQG